MLNYYRLNVSDIWSFTNNRFIRVPLPSDKLKIIVDPFLPGKTYAYYAKAVVKNREDADNWESEMQYLTTRANGN